MKRRRSKRAIVKLKAERISGDKDNAVFIENISEHGIYMITAPSHTASKFPPGTELDLKFLLPLGETLTLHCKVIWSFHKIPPNGLTNSVGMEIIDPPPKYREFVKSLY